MNLNARLYERFFCFLFPAGGLYFKLRPTKMLIQGRF